MNVRLRTESEASKEIEEATLWYDDRRPGLGAEFLDCVDLTLRRIASWPDAGAPIHGLPENLHVRRVPVGRFPYHVVYVMSSGTIRILAVAHDRRIPRYLELQNRSVVDVGGTVANERHRGLSLTAVREEPHVHLERVSGQRKGPAFRQLRRRGIVRLDHEGNRPVEAADIEVRNAEAIQFEDTNLI